MRALTGLSKANVTTPGAVADTTPGKLPVMALSRIHPDPRNKILRDKDSGTPEAIEEQRQLNADVRKVGIKSPLSLRAHPTKPGEYIVNHGHRRRLAALDADLVEVPYFIDEKFTSYDQVKENLLRRDLTPWAFAEFIKAQEAEGESKTKIAEGLGKGKNFVTEHAVLIDAPACVHVAYESGVKSARTLYDLSRAFQEFPEPIDTWCASGAKITRDTIQEQLQVLRNASIGGIGSDQADSQPAVGDQPLDQSATEPGLRHDVQTKEVQQPLENTSVLRHDVQTKNAQPPSAAAPKVRHDVQTQNAPSAAKSDNSQVSNTAAVEIAVQYKGKTARIAPNTTITIVVEGHDKPLEVPVAEVVFKGK